MANVKDATADVKIRVSDVTKSETRIKALQNIAMFLLMIGAGTHIAGLWLVFGNGIGCLILGVEVVVVSFVLFWVAER